MVKKEILNQLSLILVDVDGTLTDSGLIYDDAGNEWKRFSTRDYIGVAAAHYIGIELMVITGRESGATVKRMNEMGISKLFQNVKNKKKFLEEYFLNEKIDPQCVGFIGDDLNDYAAMKLVGYRACPLDAAEEIKAISNYVSCIKGGYGVLQDVLRYILKSRNQWTSFVQNVIECI